VQHFFKLFGKPIEVNFIHAVKLPWFILINTKTIKIRWETHIFIVAGDHVSIGDLVANAVSRLVGVVRPITSLGVGVAEAFVHLVSHNCWGRRLDGHREHRRSGQSGRVAHRIRRRVDGGRCSGACPSTEKYLILILLLWFIQGDLSSKKIKCSLFFNGIFWVNLPV